MSSRHLQERQGNMVIFRKTRKVSATVRVTSVATVECEELMLI